MLVASPSSRFPLLENCLAGIAIGIVAIRALNLVRIGASSNWPVSFAVQWALSTRGRRWHAWMRWSWLVWLRTLFEDSRAGSGQWRPGRRGLVLACSRGARLFTAWYLGLRCLEAAGRCPAAETAASIGRVGASVDRGIAFHVEPSAEAVRRIPPDLIVGK